MLTAEPHPLDFDWRFDDATISKLCGLVRGHNILALGAPSVARRIQATGGSVQLVDRQPVQRVRNHLVADAQTFHVAEGRFDMAVVDSPWYPRELVEWASAAGRAVGPGGKVFVSVWPPETRPSAVDDLSRALAELNGWASVTETPIELAYEAPLFESVALSISETEPLARSPKHARLVRLDVRLRPPPAPRSTRPPLWHRFFLDGYQLGVRLEPRDPAQRLVAPHPNAKGWRWPFVSARAPGIDRIGIWSSAGEVAQVGNPRHLISVLQEAISAESASSFDAALSPMPELISWKIPRPPYERTLEWQHP
jgi:hypothetical protein